MRSVRSFPLLVPMLMALVLVFGQLARFATPVELAASPHPHHTQKLSVAEAPVRDILPGMALAGGGLLLLVFVALFREAEEDFAAWAAEHLHLAELSLLSRAPARRYVLRV